MSSVLPLFEIESPERLVLNTPIVMALANAFGLFEKADQPRGIECLPKSSSSPTTCGAKAQAALPPDSSARPTASWDGSAFALE